MKIVFRNNELEELANGFWDYMYPLWIWKKYRLALHIISDLETVKEIRAYHWWKAEWKKWDRWDQLWIRLNDQWRLILKFQWKEVIVALVREVSKHYE